jgi:hypothetical protein
VPGAVLVIGFLLALFAMLASASEDFFAALILGLAATGLGFLAYADCGAAAMRWRDAFTKYAKGSQPVADC